MGFFEDDRIRRKNVVHNEAYNYYNSMKATGLTDADVLQVCTNKLRSKHQFDVSRNEIYRRIMEIAKGNSDEISD